MKNSNATKKVSIYSTPTCHYCNLAKDFFNENSVKYEAFDVASDLEKRREMVEKTGQLGVPVIIIDGEAIVGFDKDYVAGKLGLK